MTGRLRLSGVNAQLLRIGLLWPVLGFGYGPPVHGTYCVEDNWWAVELLSVEQLEEGVDGEDLSEPGRWDNDARFWQARGAASLYWYQDEELYMLDLSWR